jgi:CSLREA domain-containing protein
VLSLGLLGLFALPDRFLNFLQPTVHAATTFNVNSTGDGADNNVNDGVCNDGAGNCTLRAAIQQANASAGTNTINFSVAGTISLTSALPDIAASMTISGPGARLLTVSGNNANRVFTIVSSATVTISGLTISGGKAAGAAGISNVGTLTINECAISDNHATGSGGGISNCGSLEINNSTISDNSAVDRAGGLITGSCGSGSAVLTNTTVSSNSAGIGGGIVNANGLTLRNTTVSGNSATNIGGGIYNPGIGILNFGNTLIAGNSADSSGPDCSGARFNSEDYNLIGDTGGCGIIGNTAHNISDVAPGVGPLQDNGGPTLTHAPLPGSPAIDQGNSTLATDQRGQPRPGDSPGVANAVGGNGSDIGASETQPAEILVVNSLADASDGSCDSQNCTLREALNAANSSADYNAIYFTVAGTIDLTGALPDVATAMTLDGPGAKVLTVRRNTGGNYRIFTVASGVKAGIFGLTISGGDPGGGNGGGGISNSGTLSLTGVAVSGNNAIGGGGIFNGLGTLNLTNSTISDNNAGFGNGGGIFNSGGDNGLGTLNVKNSTISNNNDRSGSGGGIFNFGAVAITNSTVSDNVNRGIVSLGTGRVTLAGSIIANNTGTFEHDLQGDFVSNGYNLIRTPDSAAIIEAQNPGTNIIGQDPKLGPLADNGGPTRTQALLAGSPAIDKGRSFATDSGGNLLLRDQRGTARPFDHTSIAPAPGGDNSDIGAFELNPVAENISDKATNEDTPLSFSFFVGDQTVSSLTATSSNPALVPDANISITGNGPGRTVQITPVANLSGVSDITINLNGSNEGTVSRTFGLTVRSVNDAPSFTKGGDQTVLEDAGPQTFTSWATAISAGPGESTQSLSFLVTGNTNPGLFSSAPVVSPDGTLTYTPAPNANGSAVVTVTLKDNGGTANGGQDTSLAQTFNIGVTAVNDPPTANGQTVTVDEDTPKLITLDGSDVDGDALIFRIVLAPLHGNLSGAGASRTYTPAADFNGSDSFTYRVIDTSGVESAPATVNISVAAVNDAPVNTVPGPQATARDTPLVFSVADSNAISTSDVDAGNGAVRLTLSSSGGTLTLGGTAGLTFVSGDGVDDSTMTFTGNIASVNAALAGLVFKPNAGFDGAASLQITTDDQGLSGAGGARSDTDSVSITVERSLFEFSQPTYTVAEGAGSLAVTVRRAGDTSQAASVDYATDDGSVTSVSVPCSAVTGLALARCDFTQAQGTLRFAAGETEKTFGVLVSDDSYVEGTEIAHVTLSNPDGVTVLGPRVSVKLEITDDAPESAANPIDDSAKFVRQHYHDFLNREPDAPGLQFWTGEIEGCGTNAQCREVKRINVSAAFFLSIEFQETGYLVERTYKAAYGDTTSPNVAGTVPSIRLSEFQPDAQRIGLGVQVGVGNWEQQLEANKNAYILEFVQRQRFTDAFPASMTPAQFIDKLNQNAGGVLSQAERDQLVAELAASPDATQGRASALRKVSEDTDLRSNEKNRAFVLMQYFGYLRRNPDDAPDADYTGWKFWLSKLEQFNGNFIQAEMVKAFLDSVEYRNRFGQ